MQRNKLDIEKLNLDGTTYPDKKSLQSECCQARKRGRTSNILIMTDAKGAPIAQGGILSGNHNDLFEIVLRYAGMIKELNHCEIDMTGNIQNADRGFDSKPFRRTIQPRKMKADII